jgi:transcriptional regulator with XRE-family HTH domain
VVTIEFRFSEFPCDTKNLTDSSRSLGYGKKILIVRATMNLKLKAELIRRYGTQIEAAKALTISESRLSYIIRGHISVSSRVQAKLAERLGAALTRRLLAKPRQARAARAIGASTQIGRAMRRVGHG